MFFSRSVIDNFGGRSLLNAVATPGVRNVMGAPRSNRRSVSSEVALGCRVGRDAVVALGLFLGRPGLRLPCCSSTELVDGLLWRPGLYVASPLQESQLPSHLWVITIGARHTFSASVPAAAQGSARRIPPYSSWTAGPHVA